MRPTPTPPPPTPTPPPSPARPPLIPNETDDDNNYDGNHLTLTQLKILVRMKLRESGAIDDILGQLRGHLLRPLAQVKYREDQQAQLRSSMSLEAMVLNSLVVDFLRHQKFRQTLAVFLPESHMLDQHHALSRHDLAKTLILAQSEDKDERKSLLHALVLPLRRAKQTSVPSSFSSSSSSSSHTQTQTDTTTTTTPPFHHHHHEERLRRFQHECEAHAQKEIAAEMAHFRETELTHLRLEEAAKHRRELLIVREEIQATQDRRVEQAWAQAKEEERRVYARLAAGEAAQFEARQAVLRDMEAMRRREEEVERAEARAAERQAGLDKEHQVLIEQTAAWARQRAGEVAAAHEEGAKAYASQLQSLQVQQRFLQEELRKVQVERVVFQEQGVEVKVLRKEVEEARGCVEEVEGLRKETERWVLEKGRLQRQEEEAWAREQEATAMVRDLERTCVGLESENEKMRQEAGEDEVELEGLREEVRTLRGLLVTSRKALDCLGGRVGGREGVEAQQGQSAAITHSSLPLSFLESSQTSSLSSAALPPRTGVSLSTSSPMPLPMPVLRSPPSPLRRQVGGGYSCPPPSTFSSSSSSLSSTAIDSAMRAYETEVQKLQDVHDEFLLLRESGRGNGGDAAAAAAAGAVKRQSEEAEEEVVEEEEGVKGEIESQEEEGEEEKEEEGED